MTLTPSNHEKTTREPKATEETKPTANRIIDPAKTPLTLTNPPTITNSATKKHLTANSSPKFHHAPNSTKVPTKVSNPRHHGVKHLSD